MRPFWLTAYEPEIQRELLVLGHHNLGAVIPTGLVLTGVVYLASASQAPPAGLWAWLLASVLARGFAAALWLWFRPVVRMALPSPVWLQRWMWAHGLAMVLLGLSVGLLGALFVPASALTASPEGALQNLFLTMAFLGATAYSAAGNGPHDLPAFLLSIASAAAVMLATVPAAFGPQAGPVAAMCGVFCVLMVAVGVRAHGLLLTNIRLRLANGQLAREQAAAAALAHKANREKSEFLAAASHDLRQPVHALMLLVAALQRGLPPDRSQLRDGPEGPDGRGPALAGGVHDRADGDRLITSIGEAADAIAHQFDSLMDLSRLESGHHPVRPAPLDLGLLLRQLVDRHAPAPNAADGVHLGLRLARRAQGVWVHTDRLMLERSIGNLLSNALRYTRRGRVLLTLRLQADGALVMAVHDTGPGIAPDQQARIFQPYVQLGNAERDRRQGLGLGLAIVRQCAGQLGLELGLVSAPGRGSCFRLMLPAALRCAPAACGAADGAAAGSAAAWAAPALAGRRMLLIDDDPMVRSAMARLLASWRLDCRMARDGDDPVIGECLSQGWTPELLLCDQRLPGAEHGLQLLGRLQAHWPAAAALLQTGEPAAQVAADAEAAGYPVLYKPVSAARLAQVLQALMPAPTAAGSA